MTVGSLATLNSMGMFILTILLYFSGTAKVILTRLSFTKFVIRVLDETMAPTEIFRSPIMPLKGARMVVLDICA